MFHISQLKLYKKLDDNRRTYSKPNPIVTSEGMEEYEVEKVINHRKRRIGKRTKIEYLIFWKGYPVHEATWEPEENLANAPKKVAEYYKRIEGTASLKVGSM